MTAEELTASEAARLTGLTSRVIREWMTDPELLPSIQRKGGRTMTRSDLVNALIQRGHRDKVAAVLAIEADFTSDTEETEEHLPPSSRSLMLPDEAGLFAVEQLAEALRAERERSERLDKENRTLRLEVERRKMAEEEAERRKAELLLPPRFPEGLPLVEKPLMAASLQPQGIVERFWAWWEGRG